MDVLKESATTCERCNALISSFNRKRYNWTLKRFTLKLSFSPSENKGNFSDHRKLEWVPKCIEVGVFTKALFIRKYQELESDHPSGKEMCVHGRGMLCFTEEGDPAMYLEMPWLRKIGTHTGSHSSLKVAKGWLDQCVATEPSELAHGDLGRNATKSPMSSSNKDSETSPFPTERPTRLLDFHRYHGSDARRSPIKLINTHGGIYPYAALSYCWGRIAGSWLTKTNTIEQYLREIERSNLPATIYDAVDVAAALGIGYLWVDALCIIQDSKEDWKVESAKMGGIYQGGLLTIAASKSASSYEGLFARSGLESRTIFPDYITITSRLKNGSISSLYFSKSINTMLKLDTGRFGSKIEDSPLSQRAWTYQEQVLSNRTLYLAESQLY